MKFTGAQALTSVDETYDFIQKYDHYQKYRFWLKSSLRGQGVATEAATLPDHVFKIMLLRSLF